MLSMAGNMWVTRSPSVGGTSEHLDNIVGDPLCHPRLQ
jgi:hypothetical protein